MQRGDIRESAYQWTEGDLMPHFGQREMSTPALDAPSSITVGASPFTYAALSDGLVVVDGGTVSLVQYGRGAVLTGLGLIGGAIPVLSGDTVKVTWAVSEPSMTFIPGRAR